MKRKDAIPKNHIDALLEEHGMRANKLAKAIDVSTSYMSKLRNQLAPVTPQLADRIGRVLNVDPHKVVDFPFSKRFAANCDEALLGSALSWICEAADKHKLKLTHQELSHWTSYVYKGALDEALNLQQTKFFAYVVVDIIRQIKR